MSTRQFMNVINTVSSIKEIFCRWWSILEWCILYQKER